MPSHTFKNEFTTNFEYIKANSSETHKFTVVYLHGLCSDPWGKKPESIKSFCASHNLGFMRFELAGHGSDSPNYEWADINIWKEQVLEAIDEMVEGPVLLIGMSVSGWLALLAGEARPQRVVGIIGISAAPDFTAILYHDFMAPQQRQELETRGKISFATKDFAYTFTLRLIASGNQNLLLNRPIALHCPVHLLQGMQDACYPWQKTLEIAEKISHDNVTVKLLKNAGHRMQQPQDIAEMFKSIESFL